MTQTTRSTLLRRAWAGACAIARRLRMSMQPEPPLVPSEWFTDAEVADYDASFAADDPQRIDDPTWRDLEAKALLQRLADGASALRAPVPVPAPASRRVDRARRAPRVAGR